MYPNCSPEVQDDLLCQIRQHEIKLIVSVANLKVGEREGVYDVS